MALYLSSSNLDFSFNEFKISFLPFQLACICLILWLDDKDSFFLDSFVIEITFMKKVDRWLR